MTLDGFLGRSVRVTGIAQAVGETPVDGDCLTVHGDVVGPSILAVPGVLLRAVMPGLGGGAGAPHHVIVSGFQGRDRLLICDQPGPALALDFMLLHDLLGHGLPADTCINAIYDNAGDVGLGGLRDVSDAGCAPQLRMAQELRTVHASEAIGFVCYLHACGVGGFPQGLEDVFQGLFLSTPVDEAAQEGRYQRLFLLIAHRAPRLGVLCEFLSQVGVQHIPHGPVGLLAALQRGFQAFPLLAEKLHGGDLKPGPVLLLSGHEEVGDVLDTGLLIVRPIGVLMLQGQLRRSGLRDDLQVAASGGLIIPGPAGLLHQLGHDFGGVVVCIDVNIRHGNLEDVAAALQGLPAQQLPGLILHQQSGVPAVYCQGLVKLLGPGDDVIEVPHQTRAEQGEDLGIDGLLPAAQARG